MTNDKLQVYKFFKAARDAANGRPIVKLGQNYLVGDFDGLESIEIINGGGEFTGTITLRHIERLGNGNHAVANPQWAFRVQTPAFWKK